MTYIISLFAATPWAFIVLRVAIAMLIVCLICALTIGMMLWVAEGAAKRAGDEEWVDDLEQLRQRAIAAQKVTKP